MRAGALRKLRSVQSIAAVVGALVALAGAGLALTYTLFPNTKPTPIAETVTATITLPTTAQSTTRAAARSQVSHSTGVYTILSVVFAGSLLLVVVGDGVRRARQRLRDRVDREIVEVGDGGGTVRAVTQTVMSRPGVAGDERELVSQLVRRRFLQEAVSETRDLELFDFLPPRPRTVKRAWNDFLLRAGLATQRGLLVGDSPVQPNHLCKWVVLFYAWPEVARTLEEVPALMNELEEANDRPALEEALAKAGVHVSRSDLLINFIRTEPHIAPILDDVTRLQHR